MMMMKVSHEARRIGKHLVLSFFRHLFENTCVYNPQDEYMMMNKEVLTTSKFMEQNNNSQGNTLIIEQEVPFEEET